MEVTKTGNSQILAEGSLRVRISTVLVLKNVPLILRPNTPIVFGVRVGGAIPFA